MGKEEKNWPRHKKRGLIFLFFWFVLILLGIFEKRILDHADRMVFYHLPAAVFLVLGWYQLSAKVRHKYQAALAIAKANERKRTRKEVSSAKN